MRHIILHHHFFKNAGSTLDYALARQFPGWFMHLEDEGDLIVPQTLIKFLRANPHAKAISSHNFGGQLFELDLTAARITASHYALVRRPLDRLISVYKYFRRSEPSTDLARVAAQLSLREFLWLLIERYPFWVDNAQVTTIANNGHYGRCTNDDDFDRACARYQSFALCAPLERYDEAMVTLEYFDAPNYAPDVLDLAYVRQNVSERIDGEDHLKELLGSELHDCLSYFTQRDERLWQFANAELDRRIGMVPQFGKRLANFRERCIKVTRTL